MSSFRHELTPEVFNDRSRGHLPGLVGLQILTMTEQGVESRLEVRKDLMAPNGFLNAATVVALADTSCGYGCVTQLPHRDVPLHPNGPVAPPSRQFSSPMLQSLPMTRWFFGFFFYFPRPLAEEIG